MMRNIDKSEVIIQFNEPVAPSTQHSCALEDFWTMFRSKYIIVLCIEVLNNKSFSLVIFLNRCLFIYLKSHCWFKETPPLSSLSPSLYFFVMYFKLHEIGHWLVQYFFLQPLKQSACEREREYGGTGINSRVSSYPTFGYACLFYQFDKADERWCTVKPLPFNAPVLKQQFHIK